MAASGRRNSLKKAFAAAVHAGLAYAGAAAAWYVPGAVFAAAQLLGAASLSQVSMFDVASHLPARDLALLGGWLAAGMGVSALGYARVLDRPLRTGPAPRKDALSHVYNYSAAALGTAVSAVSAFYAWQALAQPPSPFENRLAVFAASAAICAAGLAGFAAGYNRRLGRTLPPAPQ
jgi:hypothetical protein